MKTSLIPMTTGYESILIDGEISDPKGSKRVSRKKLLNGGTHINNEGYDIKDSTISISYELKSDADFEKINDIFVNNIDVLIETETDILECVISSFNADQGIALLELWPERIATVKSDIEYPDPFDPPWYFFDYVHSSYWVTETYYNGVIWNAPSPFFGGPNSVNGTWADYYKPEKIRVVFTGIISEILIYAGTHGSGSSGLHYELFSPVSGVTYDIPDYGSFNEIRSFSWIATAPVTISNFELWVDGAAPAERTWTDYTSDSYWEDYGFGTSTWDGSRWVQTGGGFYPIVSIGSWFEELRPSKIRLTVSGNSGTLEAKFFVDLYTICFGTDYQSLTEMPTRQGYTETTGSSTDINYFTLRSSLSETFYIDKIELLI